VASDFNTVLFTPEGGDPYLGVRFGYDLGTFFSVLGYYLDRTWVRFFPYLGTFFSVFGYGFFRTWIVLGYGLGVLGYGLGRTWVRLGSY
jgi:hypothetical protein